MTDWDEGAREALRGAASLGRGAAGVELLRVRPLEPVLQYAGDVLVAALGQTVPEARPLAEKCLQALDARGEAGDRELAEQLVQALGDGAGEGERLAPVPIDLGELAGALYGRLGDGPFVLDLALGDVVPADEAFGELLCEEPGDDRERWLTLSPEPAAPGVPTDASPDALFVREERERGRARLWLAAYGLRPSPRRL
ncbi:hypothetical protein SMC26_01185 [Actinomadura fulvescens]|uniref:Uncharacterized protein n=1 Tax=Actinomadura fulvescens TaxID=46160 RepID=A0ABN3QC98_9ACTN